MVVINYIHTEEMITVLHIVLTTSFGKEQGNLKVLQEFMDQYIS